MSTNRNLFLAVTAVLAVAASAVGAVEYVRQPKRRSTAEQWLRLLSGANLRQPAQDAPVKTGSPAEIIGRAGYPLYKS